MCLAVLLHLAASTVLCHFGPTGKVELDVGRGKRATVSVHLGEQETWRRTCGVETAAIASRHAMRFTLISPGWLALFDYRGRCMRFRALPAARDPRPYLQDDEFIVWGENVFNWIGFGKSAYRWQMETRRFCSMRLKTGAIHRLSSYKTVGFPLCLVGPYLFSITFRDWAEALAHRSPRAFVLGRIDLRSGEASRSRIRVPSGAGAKLFALIVGWEAWQDTHVATERSSGRFLISVRAEGWQGSLRITVPSEMRTRRHATPPSSPSSRKFTASVCRTLISSGVATSSMRLF